MSKNTIDMTGLSDRVIDALLAFVGGDDEYDFEQLTLGELRSLDLALGKRGDISLWIRTEELKQERERPVRCAHRGVDYEALILERDEAYDPCAS